MIQGFIGTDLLIHLQLSGGEINLYPQVLIYDKDRNLLGTYDMPHQATGFYYYDWIPPSTGQYIGVFKVYTNAIHTILSADYGFEEEDFIILNTPATEVALNNHDTKLDTVDGIVDRILTATEVRQVAVNDAGATSTKFITTLVEIHNNFWNRGAVLFTSGDNTGQIRAIKSYAGGTKEIVLKTPLHVAPADGDTFVIVVARKFLVPDVDEIKISVETIAGKLPNNNIMGSSVKTDKDDEVDSIKITTDKLDNTLEDDAGTYRFTENALEEAHSGGGGDATLAKQNEILSDLAIVDGSVDIVVNKLPTNDIADETNSIVRKTEIINAINSSSKNFNTMGD